MPWKLVGRVLLFFSVTGARLKAGVPTLGGTGGAGLIPVKELFPGKVLTLRCDCGVELDVLEDWGVELAVVESVVFLSHTKILLGSLVVTSVTDPPSMSSSSMYRGVFTR